MVKWILAKDIQGNEWDKQLFKFSNYDFYQCYDWGEYKKQFGWYPYRFLAIDSENKILGMSQLLLKKLPLSIGMLWCPGGPVGDKNLINKDFINTCFNETKKRILYIRIRPKYQYSERLEMKLKNDGWKESIFKITNGSSMYLNLDISEKEIMNNLSKNWRRNLNRYKYEDVIISKWNNIEADEMIKVYRDLEKFKNIKMQYSDHELKKILLFFKGKIILFRCDNLKGDLVAFRGAIVLGNNAYDFFAATNHSARKLYASNKLLMTIMLECKSMNISYYDLSGIDPINNPGVYNFKKGTGAKHFQSIGEWDWSNIGPFRIIFNKIISKRLS